MGLFQWRVFSLELGSGFAVVQYLFRRCCTSGFVWQRRRHSRKHYRLSLIRSQLRQLHPFSACIPDSYSSRSPIEAYRPIPIRRSASARSREALTIRRTDPIGSSLLAFPDQTRLAHASARDRSSSRSSSFQLALQLTFQLTSVRGSLGGSVSTICKQKVTLILRT
ncbi:hypothetical protein F2Q69_00038160 [Brassica cretica]|uniref:Uncharacterized protein n=1 Tax=Brassica cretica TaxID=69181 RepID=A0A8S9SR77_BRACR|nr:hypothetical protein F2Q69_00038160 [Brassica cretica]